MAEVSAESAEGSEDGDETRVPGGK
jgi:hypothetical protein